MPSEEVPGVGEQETGDRGALRSRSVSLTRDLRQQRKNEKDVKVVQIVKNRKKLGTAKNR
jgi:hypothetical protein